MFDSFQPLKIETKPVDSYGQKGKKIKISIVVKFAKPSQQHLTFLQRKLKILAIRKIGLSQKRCQLLRYRHINTFGWVFEAWRSDTTQYLIHGLRVNVFFLVISHFFAYFYSFIAFSQIPFTDVCMHCNLQGFLQNTPFNVSFKELKGLESPSS